MDKRKDGRSQFEIRPFTVYEVDSLNANSRSFLESNDTKIFCSM